jgi:IS5 family transposase
LTRELRCRGLTWKTVSDPEARGLAKNTAQLHTLFALSNLWMARGKFAGALA